MEIMKAVLGLEDGTYVVGEGFGVEGECTGELVFSTQMTGYMEALTDPSYFGQILLFTYPMIGNYGVDLENFQAPAGTGDGDRGERGLRLPDDRHPDGPLLRRERAPRHRGRGYPDAHDQDESGRDAAGCPRHR